MVKKEQNKALIIGGVAIMIGLAILLLESRNVIAPEATSEPEDGEFLCGQTNLEDIDENHYSTVKIGDQCWMAENLRTTHYSDGAEIPFIKDHNDWWDDTEGSYALYDHNFLPRFTAEPVESDQEMKEAFGYLYNFYAVNTEKLCPEGWRVPSDEEWQELEIALGMSKTEAKQKWHRGTDEGSRLAGGEKWWDDDGIITEHFGVSGFNARPAGYRRSYGDYGNLYSNANFWTRNEGKKKGAVSREIYAGTPYIYRVTSISKNNGHSVRCLKK